MEYPTNGSVVIIDDKFEEIEGLIRVLSSKGIPTTYFNGIPDELIPLNGTRVVFLDLDLKIGVQDAEEQTIVSNVFSNLKKLIPKNNGGYILIIWSSRDSEYGPIVKNRLNEAKVRAPQLLEEFPLEILNISKYDVGTLTAGIIVFDTELIKEKINSILPKNNIINLLSFWENKVVTSSKKVINNFKEIAITEEDQKKILALFADAATKTGTLNKDNILTPAIAPMSILLSDQLLSNSNIRLDDIAEELIHKLGNKIDLNSVSKINTFYHIDNTESNSHEPGSVYDYNKYMEEYSCSSNNCDTKWSEGLLEKVFDRIQIPIIKFTTKFTTDLNNKQPAEILSILSENQRHILIHLNKLTCENTSDLLKENLLYEFITRESDKKKILKSYYIQKEKDTYTKRLKENTIPIFLEFTPGCDYVQGKRKKLRLIFGFLLPYNFENILDGQTKTKFLTFSGDNIISTPIIEYKNKAYQVFFDLHTITGINENTFSDIHSIFRFRKELLVDIQQKIATHISRPGFFNMNDYLN